MRLASTRFKQRNHRRLCQRPFVYISHPPKKGHIRHTQSNLRARNFYIYRTISRSGLIASVRKRLSRASCLISLIVCNCAGILEKMKDKVSKENKM